MLSYDDAGHGECVVLIHGHLPNLEAPARFNEALLAFLGRHAP